MSRWKKRQMIREINTHTSPIWVPGIQGRKVWKLSFLSFFISDSLFVSLMEFVINLAAGGSIWRVGDNTLPSGPGVRRRKSSILPTPAQHFPSQHWRYEHNHFRHKKKKACNFLARFLVNILLRKWKCERARLFSPQCLGSRSGKYISCHACNGKNAW